MERGQDYGVALAGYFAMRSLRVEKFYAFWGQDLGTTTTPLECGRGFRVKFNVSSSGDLGSCEITGSWKLEGYAYILLVYFGPSARV